MTACVNTPHRWRPIWIPIAPPPNIQQISSVSSERHFWAEEVLLACEKTNKAVEVANEEQRKAYSSASSKNKEAEDAYTKAHKEFSFARQYLSLARIVGTEPMKTTPPVFSN